MSDWLDKLLQAHKSFTAELTSDLYDRGVIVGFGKVFQEIRDITIADCKASLEGKVCKILTKADIIKILLSVAAQGYCIKRNASKTDSNLVEDIAEAIVKAMEEK